ncbi:MAG TPA: iron ABC transporter permease, partial [Rectinema sp.]|nr:iron ABC transporter permease [Rectinema sp.]
MKRLARDPVLLAVILLVTASLAIFILYPLVEVAATSLDVGGGRLGLGVYSEVAESAYIRKALYNSLFMSTLTAIVGTIIGFIFAFAVVRAKVPLSRFFNTIAVIPIVSPPFIGALAIIMLFGNNGLISWNLLKIQNFPIYGFNGLFIAQVVTFFPV